jgi:hypothetical protein
MKTGGQKGVLLMVSEEFLSEIDAHYPKFGYSDRASFIRDAVWQLIKTYGVTLPLAYKAAPSRAGKGGRPRKSALASASAEEKPRKRA